MLEKNWGRIRQAQRLMEEQIVESIRFEQNDKVLVVATRNPATLFAQLPQWTLGTEIRVHEVRSLDDSLQTLFDSLLRIHRGASPER